MISRRAKLAGALFLVMFTVAMPERLDASGSGNNGCLYPSQDERFGVTIAGRPEGYDIAQLGSRAYHNWWADGSPVFPEGMRYYPLIHTGENGYHPNGDALRRVVLANRGATWLVGNEADTVWLDNTRPDTYARQFHEIHKTISSIDPSARFAFNGLSTVSQLRLEWLERAWNAYRTLYGIEMPVDVWNVHTYPVNEMVHEWGPQIPPGIENVVAYSDGTWHETSLSGASGGTVHRSDHPGSSAYFAFHGPRGTLRLSTGPRSGFARIVVDTRHVETVDLYAPVPGILTRTFDNLVVGTPLLEDWHHVRVQVTTDRNPASKGLRVGVDALEASSTIGLPGGRLENDYHLQARIVQTVDGYTDLSLIDEQLRAFRRWMKDHGQQHKPLINSEFGMLLTKEHGIGYVETRDYMLGVFEYFMNSAIDPELGHPGDGNRLLQEWFWYILAKDVSHGEEFNTDLFDSDTKQILPLGRDYSAFVRGLRTGYTDLETTFLSATPTWPLFQGQAAHVQIQGAVRNRGNTPAGSFRILLTENDSAIQQYVVDGLSAANQGKDTFPVDLLWTTMIQSNRTLTLAADSAGQVDEPCDPNNSRSTTLVVPPYLDLSLDSFELTSDYIAPLAPGDTGSLSFQTTLTNLGSRGSPAEEIVITLWEGTPGVGGRLLDRQVITRGTPAPATVRLRWPDARPGRYHVTVRIEQLPGDAHTDNNQQELDVFVPAHAVHLPALPLGG